MRLRASNFRQLYTRGTSLPKHLVAAFAILHMSYGLPGHRDCSEICRWPDASLAATSRAVGQATHPDTLFGLLGPDLW